MSSHRCLMIWDALRYLSWLFSCCFPRVQDSCGSCDFCQPCLHILETLISKVVHGISIWVTGFRYLSWIPPIWLCKGEILDKTSRGKCKVKDFWTSDPGKGLTLVNVASEWQLRPQQNDLNEILDCLFCGNHPGVYIALLWANTAKHAKLNSVYEFPAVW